MASILILRNLAMALTPTGGVSPANPFAKPGPIGDGEKIVVEITEVPEGVSLAKVCQLYAGTADLTWLGNNGRNQRFRFRFEELGIGRIIRA